MKTHLSIKDLAAVVIEVINFNLYFMMMTLAPRAIFETCPYLSVTPSLFLCSTTRLKYAHLVRIFVEVSQTLKGGGRPHNQTEH